MNWNEKYNELYYHYKKLENDHKILIDKYTDLEEDYKIIKDKYKMCNSFFVSMKKKRTFSEKEYSELSPKLSKPTPKSKTKYTASPSILSKKSPPKKSPPKSISITKSIIKKSPTKSKKKVKFED